MSARQKALDVWRSRGRYMTWERGQTTLRVPWFPPASVLRFTGGEASAEIERYVFKRVPLYQRYSQTGWIILDDEEHYIAVEGT